ncbi:hypothetical protein FKW77_004781 [Venturia effusa]|uniref:Uncharacterized protein n=1 Tax=Venturia effusa TaxID=50376 RepID=A0A517LIM7_9PEZI|nr:hypothetical protein FKW77_004781 [Venturia effusa]
MAYTLRLNPSMLQQSESLLTPHSTLSTSAPSITITLPVMAQFSDFVTENDFLKMQIIENLNTLHSADNKHAKDQELKIVTVEEGNHWRVKVMRESSLKVVLSADVKDGIDRHFNPKTLNAGLRALHGQSGHLLGDITYT